MPVGEGIAHAGAGGEEEVAMRAALANRCATSARGSVATNHVRAYDLLRMFGREGRLPPLEYRNLNLLGRYSFTATVPAAGVLRPLRDPDTPELDEDEDGSGQQ